MRKLAWTAWALAMLAVAPDLSARESSRAKEVPVRNVIYMIGDGMGLTHVSMMMLEEGYRPTSFDRSQNVALIRPIRRITGLPTRRRRVRRWLRAARRITACWE